MFGVVFHVALANAEKWEDSLWDSNSHKKFQSLLKAIWKTATNQEDF